MGKKTASLWGRPPSRYYNFLKRVESYFPSQQLEIAIVGCSDGKFVLPAARRGHRVFAIDFDEVALFGGTKVGPTGNIYMPGLVTRLKMENLLDRVQVVHGDFVEYSPARPAHGVFTSGAVQYSRNMKHSMVDMVRALQAYVMQEGYFYIDYMLPMEAKYQGRDNYPDRERWNEFFSTGEWNIIYNRVLPPVFEAAHVDKPVDHYHHWGHLLVQRKVSER